MGPTDADGGPLVFTGDRFGMAWSDRRDARGAVSDYEIYFNLINPDGTKRMPDLRLTHAEVSRSANRWRGQAKNSWCCGKTTAKGSPKAETSSMPTHQCRRRAHRRKCEAHRRWGQGPIPPAIAAGERSLGVTWRRSDKGSHQLMFAPFHHDSNLWPNQ